MWLESHTCCDKSMTKVLYNGFWQNICMSIDVLIFYHYTKTSLVKCIRTLKESCVCRVVPIHHIFVFIRNKHINIIIKNCTCYKSVMLYLLKTRRLITCLVYAMHSLNVLLLMSFLVLWWASCGHYLRVSSDRTWKNKWPVQSWLYLL